MVWVISSPSPRGAGSDLQGAYAEYIVVPEGMVLSKPKELSWVEAAALPENWMTGGSYQLNTTMDEKRS
jgi:NADPH:quinone reductase-like Zn-dependent oxidoreductase